MSPDSSFSPQASYSLQLLNNILVASTNDQKVLLGEFKDLRTQLDHRISALEADLSKQKELAETHALNATLKDSIKAFEVRYPLFGTQQCVEFQVS